MSTLSITTSDSGSGSRRKITVNERVDRILHGALQSEEPRTASADARNEDAARRSRQFSNLYTRSLDDKFVRSRVASDARDASKSVPKNAHLARQLESQPLPAGGPNHSDSSSGLRPAAPPTKPGKCYAKLMLEQIESQDSEERRRAEENRFRAPDFSPPKPWYKGCARDHKAPSCTVDAKVRRYGAYGTIKMLANEKTIGSAPPFMFHSSQSLESLVYIEAPNAWSPSLHDSPSSWPENSNFVNGSKLKTDTMTRCPSPDFRFPTHVVGKTTPPIGDAHYARRQHVHAQDARELELAFDDEKARRRREIAYNKEKLEHWKASLHFEPLSSKMDHPFVKVHAKRAKELTILHNAAYSPAARFEEQVEKLASERFALRWQNMSVLLEVMRKTPCRRPVIQDIEKLFALSYEISLKNHHHLQLNRQQFWDLLSREYPHVKLKHINRVFSSFDYKMEDRIDMRLFCAIVRAMRVQQVSPIEVITMALQDFDISKRQVVLKADHLATVIAMCSGSDVEERALVSGAHSLWSQILHEFTTEKEERRQRRLHGLDGIDGDGALFGDATVPSRDKQISDEAQSEIESLLFVGRDDELHVVPIQFVRNILRSEKQLLKRYTDALVARREECAAFAAAAAKSRVTTPLVNFGANRGVQR